MLLYHIYLDILAFAKKNPRARLLLSLAGLVFGSALAFGGVAFWGFLFPKMAKTYAVHGTVSYEGSPVAVGEIVFEPPAGDGQMRSAMITGGTFALTAKEGLPRGRNYVVRVKGFRKTGKKYENADMNVSADVTEQYLPCRHNSESAIHFESTALNLRSAFTLHLQ